MKLNNFFQKKNLKKKTMMSIATLLGLNMKIWILKVILKFGD
jgi:hypothetical protein